MLLIYIKIEEIYVKIKSKHKKAKPIPSHDKLPLNETKIIRSNKKNIRKVKGFRKL